MAEDLLSDVFFDAWQQAGRFEGRAAVTTWLLSIARFKALSARRRRIDAELDETIEASEHEQELREKDVHALHPSDAPERIGRVDPARDRGRSRAAPRSSSRREDCDPGSAAPGLQSLAARKERSSDANG